MDDIHEIRPGVAVVILDEQRRVLLQKHTDVGQWGLPSGDVQPGDTVTEAALREVKEETNLQVRLVRLVGVYSDPTSEAFRYPDGRAVHFVTLCFLAEMTAGNLRANSESLAVRFFPCDDLPRDLLPMHPRWLEDALAGQELPFIR